MDDPTVIIGAGLTGLSCAYHLDRDYLLIERELEPGGVVRTKTRAGGFLCDGTGHWLHLRHPYTRDLVTRLMGTRMITHERKAVVYSHGAFTPYPFQANTYGLPREVVLECLLGLLKARHPEDFGLDGEAAPPQNFREWILRHFGEGIARHFMIPYNEKLLGVRVDELMPDYAERFVPRPSTEDVLKGALGFSREHLGYNATFSYPREGGIGVLPRALAARLSQPPRYGVEVEEIDLHAKTVTLDDGRRVRYGRLVNTMPLKSFVGLLREPPRAVIEAAARLRATNVHYFDVGVRGSGTSHSHYHWVYVPEPNLAFYRVGSYSAVHAGSAPDGCRSYYVEMSGLTDAELADRGALRNRVLAELKRVHVLATNDEILFTELCTIPHAYVIFDRHYEQSRATVVDYLAQHSTISTGRWGGWGYGGMEDALLDGKAAADFINGEEARRPLETAEELV